MDYVLREPGPVEPSKTLPVRIVEHFAARIFTGALAPDTRLPSDRELAPLMGVDRTSLRMAMQQLARMRVVRVVHGSGVRVLDFREHAGLDFLDLVFTLPQVFLGGDFLLQALDDWTDVMPTVVGRALAQATADDYRAFDATLVEQLFALDAGGGPAELAALEVALQDQLVRSLGTTSLVMLGNSTRPLRRHLMQMYLEGIRLREHVVLQRSLMGECERRLPAAPEQLAATYRTYMAHHSQGLRERLSQLPAEPALIPASQLGLQAAVAAPRRMRSGVAPKPDGAPLVQAARVPAKRCR